MRNVISKGIFRKQNNGEMGWKQKKRRARESKNVQRKAKERHSAGCSQGCEWVRRACSAAGVTETCHGQNALRGSGLFSLMCYIFCLCCCIDSPRLDAMWDQWLHTNKPQCISHSPGLAFSESLLLLKLLIDHPNLIFTKQGFSQQRSSASAALGGGSHRLAGSCFH